MKKKGVRLLGVVLVVSVVFLLSVSFVSAGLIDWVKGAFDNDNKITGRVAGKSVIDSANLWCNGSDINHDGRVDGLEPQLLLSSNLLLGTNCSDIGGCYGIGADGKNYSIDINRDGVYDGLDPQKLNANWLRDDCVGEDELNQRCIDSDGEWNINVFGNVSFNGAIVYDECNGNNITERYCYFDSYWRIGSHYMVCENGCNNGVCREFGNLNVSSNSSSLESLYKVAEGNADVVASIKNANESSWCGGADINRDGIVDGSDAMQFGAANISSKLPVDCELSNNNCTTSEGYNVDIVSNGVIDGYDVQRVLAWWNVTGCTGDKNGLEILYKMAEGSVDVVAGLNDENVNESSWCGGADINKDGVVDGFDAMQFGAANISSELPVYCELSNNNCTTPEGYNVDIVSNGVIDGYDIQRVLAWWNVTGCTGDKNGLESLYEVAEGNVDVVANFKNANESSWCGGADINRDGIVDGLDAMQFAVANISSELPVYCELSNNNCTTPEGYNVDIVSNGVIDGYDVQRVLAWWNVTGCTGDEIYDIELKDKKGFLWWVNPFNWF
jgi:hypothetical protein